MGLPDGDTSKDDVSCRLRAILWPKLLQRAVFLLWADQTAGSVSPTPPNVRSLLPDDPELAGGCLIPFSGSKHPGSFKTRVALTFLNWLLKALDGRGVNSGIPFLPGHVSLGMDIWSLGLHSVKNWCGFGRS